MNKPTLLVLVRHGESDMNVLRKKNVYIPDDCSGLVKGVPDHKVGLTDNGVRQAKETGLALRKNFGMFDAVYDSGYRRTVLTRELVLDAYTKPELAAIKIRNSHLVRERERGYTFDMTTKEAELYFPWLKTYYDTFGHFYARPPGGQSQADLCDQVYRFIGLLHKHRAGKKVMVVSHGHTIRAFRFNLEGWTPDYYDRQVDAGCTTDNCGVTVYRYSPATKRLELEKYNEVYWR